MIRLDKLLLESNVLSHQGASSNSASRNWKPLCGPALPSKARAGSLHGCIHEKSAGFGCVAKTMLTPVRKGPSWAQAAVVTCVVSLLVYSSSSNRCKFESSFKPSRNLYGPYQMSSQMITGAGKLHVLVTGGAGYIGSHAALRLLEEGHAVTVIDNLSRGNIGAIEVLRELSTPESFHFIQADMGDKHLLVDIFRQSKFDLVMHFAAVVNVGESVAEPLRYYRNITGNTVNLLETMLETGVKKLVFSSTCATYGNPEKLPVTEDTPTHPINPYGMAKLMAETQIRDTLAANPDFQAVILRYFNVYGSDPEGRLGEYPRNTGEYGRISGACMEAALGLKPHLTMMGTTHATPDGTTIRDYIHVEDLVAAHILGMAHAANPPALYNVGTGTGVSLRKFLDACKEATGQDIKIVEQAEPRPGDYAAVYSDVTKIASELGWSAKHTDVVEGIRHAWAWRSQHPHGYPAASQKAR